jgi:hypothetical protein
VRSTDNGAERNEGSEGRAANHVSLAFVLFLLTYGEAILCAVQVLISNRAVLIYIYIYTCVCATAALSFGHA